MKQDVRTYWTGRVVVEHNMRLSAIVGRLSRTMNRIECWLALYGHVMNWTHSNRHKRQRIDVEWTTTTTYFDAFLIVSIDRRLVSTSSSNIIRYIARRSSSTIVPFRSTLLFSIKGNSFAQGFNVDRVLRSCSTVFIDLFASISGESTDNVDERVVNGWRVTRDEYRSIVALLDDDINGCATDCSCVVRDCNAWKGWKNGV
jgi:hypothetical protein